MRVAYDVTSLHDPRTGVGAFAREVLARIARSPEVTVTAFSVSWRGRGRLHEVGVPAGVRVVRGPMAAQPLRRIWLRADIPPIEWWTGPVQVVHGPNFVVPPARRAAQLATVHDLTCVRYPELCTSDTLQYPALIRRALRRGAHLHVVSGFVAGEVAEVFGVDTDRVHVVPNGVDPLHGADAAAGRERAGAERYILAVGTIEPRKDFPLLVQAFDAVAAQDPDVHLVVAGQDGWGTPAFVAAVEQAHHRDRIVRTGWVDDRARADLLAGAAVFAYPSKYEGFGLAPLEAMAAGTPVVASRTGALPEVLGDAARLVEPGSVDDLAGALCTVLDDHAVRDHLVAAGSKQASRYSWDDCAAGIVAVYESLC